MCWLILQHKDNNIIFKDCQKWNLNQINYQKVKLGGALVEYMFDYSKVNDIKVMNRVWSNKLLYVTMLSFLIT